MRLPRLSILPLLIVLASPGLANDGAWSAAGGMGSFLKSHPTIRLVAEDLKITLDDSVGYVDVLFTFRNEGPATRVTMAFPENYDDHSDKSLDRYRSWVDGVPVKVARKELKKATEDGEEGEAVWLKEVPFAVNQTRKVRVTYRGFYSGNTSGNRSLTYILTSGASWKGRISTCKITVDYSRNREISAPYLDLKGAAWNYAGRRKQTATMRNWEPDDDLVASMAPGKWHFAINGVPVHADATTYVAHRPIVVGPLRDPLLREDALQAFFGTRDTQDGGWVMWGNRICRKFGGPFSIDAGKLTLYSGKTVGLKRGHKFVRASAKEKGEGWAKDGYFVYLKDVVEALGGKFRYSAAKERAEVRF